LGRNAAKQAGGEHGTLDGFHVVVLLVLLCDEHGEGLAERPNLLEGGLCDGIVTQRHKATCIA
jgi:hypothetical protein